MDTKEKSSLKNPKETSNFLSLLFFGWLLPIFRKGAKFELQITDLYDPLKSDESERLGDRLEREWKKELIKADKEMELGKDGNKKPRRRPNLLWAITRAFWVSYMIQGMLLLVGVMMLQIMLSVLDGWIIAYFNPGQNLITRSQVLLYAGLLVIVSFVVIFVHHHTSLRSQQIGMCIRVACCSLIYRKVLRLDQAAMNETAVGRITNLMSNDVARFDMVLIYLHRLWNMPIQVALIGYVMWQSVGVAALVGIGAMMIQTVPLQVYLSKLNAKLRSKIAVKTDDRVQVMSELISGIQVVKMYSWEKPFELIVSKVRKLEIKLISLTSYLKGFNTSMVVLAERITLYVTLITFVLMGNPLSGEITFVVFSLFSILQITCAIYVPQAIVFAGETCVSLERLTDFLLLDEMKTPAKFKPTVKDELQAALKTMIDQQLEHGVEIEMVNVAANWVHGQLPPTLCKVSMKVRSQSLCAIVGPVGSGKSSLLHLLLGELPVGAGKLSFFTGDNSKTSITNQDIRISYVSQDPWLFSASVRNNILFGLPYDETRYREVTRVCALLKDFEELPQGDLSFVGERGASLSGGQRARVNLARAVYRDADLYLFDDPLSAVDAQVGRQLFEECITGFLKDKTRMLVSHQLQYLQAADTVVVLNHGSVECQGTYEELANSNLHILDPEESKVPDESQINEKKPERKVERKKSVAPADTDHQLSQVNENSEKLGDVSEEEVATGKMSNKVYSDYFLAGGNLCALAFVAVVFIAGQVVASGTDYWLTYWTNQETLRATLQLNEFSSNIRSSSNETENRLQEDGSQWFDKHGLFRPDLAIHIFTALIVGCAILITIRSILFMKICMNASRNLHNSMFANLMRATMRFFNTNPSGRILNRFSKDIGSMDELLPKAFLETFQIFTVMIGNLCTVIIVNNWMILPTIVMGVIFYFIRIYYLKTAQKLKRLEGIAKSPVFSHVNSTLDGLTTIRSRGVQVERLLQSEFDCHQNTHTGAWYLTIATANAFGLYLDFISTIFVACVCFSFIAMDDGNTLGGSVGLAITQSIILTGTVQYGIRQSTEVISQMTSVERVQQYTNLPKERSLTSENPPPPTWPPKGGLTFKDVTLRYGDKKPPVLKNLNVTINPGWKVGIVGRTGAGKSSLISALFDLTGDGLEGEIVLDGIDTKSIGLHELRPCISIIPQEPILFSASLRHNLDPFEQYSDDQLWDALREVELGDAVPSLDFRVAGGGSNFSVGQRQLICLARAILRNNRVLVLDEATANVDQKTDALIQETIRRKFANCTVLTIAHRLNTIMDSDRVLVMAGGHIVEFGHPHLLLKNRDGHFSEMLRQTGTATAERLAAIAESAFLLSQEFAEEPNHSTVNLTQNQTMSL